MHNRSRPFSRKTLPLDRRGVRRANNKRTPRMLFVLSITIMGVYLVFALRSFPKVVPPDKTQSEHESKYVESLPDIPEPSMIIEKFKEEFYKRYGGRVAAEAMLGRGIESHGEIYVTAERMLRAAALGRPFYVAFSGYSVTVGRGNHFHESFPLVLERILKEPMKKSLGIDLVVKNAAIGGIPSFPYGWCLEHFLGDEADVVSWDYGMNEGNGASAMESFLRRGMQLSNRPMFILVDSNRQRSDLLKKYVEMDIVKDAIRVNRGKNLVDQAMLEKPNQERPLGFQDWDQFGAPDGCPGKSSWHPKKKEHELIGWMIAMHLVEAMEGAIEVMTHIDDWKSQYAEQEQSNLVFPPPISKPPSGDESLTHLLYGHPQTNADEYILNEISCRTSFLPASDENRVLPSVVVSGIADLEQMRDLMMEPSLDLYKSGWVLDVDKVERDTKKKVENCGGLGYVDMKVALYGIPDSGPLRLWLPYEGPSISQDSSSLTDARTWFDDSLVICEANNKRGDQACRLDKDLTFVVGGEKAAKVTGIDGVGVYLKRQTCVLLEIPTNAKITPLDDVRMMGGGALSSLVKSRLTNGQGELDGQSQRSNVGLVVDVSIQGENVSKENGACCISHIIWEQHRR